MGSVSNKLGNTHIILDNQEINLPITLLVLLFHKLKVRNYLAKEI